MEYFDVLNENGEFTGKIESREECHKKGLWHRAVYGFIFNKNGEVLLQKRSKNKKLWPNLWDVTVGGHVLSGEFGKQALIRETKEELGIVIKENEIQYLVGSTSSNIKGNIINNHFNECYIITKDIEISQIQLQEDEVEEVRWFPKQEILARINDNFNGITEKTGPWNFLKKYYETLDKIIIEVGSTCTKIDKYDGKNVERIKEITIEFKRHYAEDKKLREKDVEKLISEINKIKDISKNIYVCGTSIFRNLEEKERKEFLEKFKKETELDFHIISQERENELTVFGATRFVNKKVCVFIGGGGSTEISIYDKKIVETANTKIGVIDIMQEFKDLGEDFATTDVETVKKYIKQKLNLPKHKADILILAGGGHEKFARLSGIKYEKNTLYEDNASPIMMDIDTRKKETERYYKEISLDEIRNKVDDPDWWYATRAMCAFVLVVAEEIGAKYIVPTDIAMVYGLLNNKEIV